MTSPGATNRISPILLLGMPQALVVDIREHGAAGAAPFPNVLRVPMSDLSDRLMELPVTTLHVLCENGFKSRRVVDYLRGLGVDAVDVMGGLAALDDHDASTDVAIV